MSRGAPSTSDEGVQPASGNPVCRVALDRRVPGRLGAVAVDTNNDVCAWLYRDVEPDEAPDISGLYRQLSVRPGELRILVGGDTARVAVAKCAEPPNTARVREALLQEGYPLQTTELAHASVPSAADAWLVAACDDARLASAINMVPADLVSMPVLAVDQLLLAQQLDFGAAVVETGPAGFSLVALSRNSQPVFRYLPPTAVADAAAEVHWALDLAQIPIEQLKIRGEWRDELVEALTTDKQCPVTEALPNRMPAALEAAWRLALEPKPPTLESASLKTRRRRLRLVRGVAVAGLVLTLLGLGVLVSGMLSLHNERERIRAFDTDTPDFRARIAAIQEVAELQLSVQALESEMAGRRLPWPPLSEALSSLARSRVERVGWERLAVSDGNLELDISVSGQTPLRDLAETRKALGAVPGLINVNWDSPMIDDRGLGAQQSLRATIRDFAAEGRPRRQ